MWGGGSTIGQRIQGGDWSISVMHGCMVWISNAKWSKRGFKAEAESLLVYSLLWACWCSLSCKIGSAAPEGCARIRSARKCVCLQLGLLLRWDWAFLHLWLVLPWASSAPARQLQAGYLLAEKFQNFICSCQVKTERMINGDQIKGGKKLMKYCNSSWWHFKLLFSVGSAESLPFYEHSALFGLYSQNCEVLFVFLTGN